MEKTVSKVLILMSVLMVALAVVPWISAVMEKEDSAKFKDKQYVLPEVSISAGAWEGDFSESLARPLFWVQRRPIESSEEIDATPTEKPTQHKLQFQGVLIKDDIKQAWIKVEGAVSAVQEGQDIAGWTVKALSASSVVLIRGDEELVLPERQEQSDTISLRRLD